MKKILQNQKTNKSIAESSCMRVDLTNRTMADLKSMMGSVLMPPKCVSKLDQLFVRL